MSGSKLIFCPSADYSVGFMLDNNDDRFTYSEHFRCFRLNLFKVLASDGQRRGSLFFGETFYSSQRHVFWPLQRNIRMTDKGISQIFSTSHAFVDWNWVL
jgi:hypothetical protein